MRITYFITVCAYLSSTVSTEENKLFLHRIKKGRSREELVLEDITAKKEIDPARIYPEAYPALGKSWPKVRLDPYQRPEKSREFQFEPQQHYLYNRDYLKRLPKRLKTRSIAGPSYELSDNHLNELNKPDSKHDEESIHIEPVYRVTTKKNVFESIMDILHQLLDPHKTDELGPLVGPIKMPGRKVYLRLIEPIDASHVMVRFVTQVPVPVIDAEKKRGPIISIPPVVDPSLLLLHGIHPNLPRPLFAQSSNHHYSIYKPRYANHTKGRIPFLGKPPSLVKNPLKDVNVEGSSSGADSNKIPFTDPQLNLKNPGHAANPLVSLPGSYYQDQTGDDAVKQVMDLINDTKLEDDISKEPPSSSAYGLSTHRLPLRQIAPLYPLTSIQQTESSSNENTYNMPSDVLTGPSSYTSPYAQFSSANSAPGYLEDSYNHHHSTPSSYSTSYSKSNDIHSTLSSYSTSYKHPIDVHTTPSSYPTSYKHLIDVRTTSSSYPTSYKHPIDIHTTPSSYSTSYQHSSEFNGGLSAYATSHQRQNEFGNGASVPSTVYGKPNDLNSAPSSYTTSYGKPDTVRPALSSNDALRVIDPPSYFPSHQKLESITNRSFERSTIRQPRYNLKNYNEVNSSMKSEHEISSWDESKQDKSESSAQTSREPSAIDDSQERWQPLMYEKAWHKAYADLTKVTKHQFDRTREVSRNVTSSSVNRNTNDRRQNNKRGTIAVTQIPDCLTSDMENDCTETKSVPSVFRTKKPKQPDVSMEPIIVTTAMTAVSSTTTIETDTKSDTGVVENLTMVNSSMISTTDKPQPLQLIITTASPAVDIMTVKPLSPKTTTDNIVTGSSTTTEKSIVIETVTKKISSKLTMKSLTKTLSAKAPSAKSMTASDPLVKSAGRNVTKGVPAPNDVKKLSNGPKMPKRPMIMKKPTFIIKQLDVSSTARTVAISSTTQKPNSTTRKSMTTRKRTFRGGTSSRKSSTT